MIKLFRKIPLPTKLLMVALLPLIFLLVFAMQILTSKQNNIRTVEKIRMQASYASEFLKAVDELQLERKSSYQFLLNPGDKGIELQLQRSRTDAALKKLDDLVKDETPEYREYALLNFLERARQRVDLRNLPPSVLVEYFSNILQRMTFSIPNVENVPVLEPISDKLNAQKQITIMVSYLGAANLNMYENQLRSKFSIDEMTPSLMAYVMYVANEKEFLAEASPSVAARYAQVKGSQPMQYGINYYNSILASPTFEAKQLDAEEWFRVSTDAVNELKKLQREMIKEASAGTNAIYESEKAMRDRTILLLAIIVVFVVSIVMITIRTISGTLLELKHAAEKIAIGNTGLQLRVETKDVIGELTRSIIAIDMSNNSLSKAAEAIGKGHFDVTITPRSEEDILSNAINVMKADLKEFTRASQQKVWLQTGLSRVDQNTRGEKDLASLTNDSLTALTEYLNAQVGLFYVMREHEELALMAGYGASGDALQQVKPGETMVGEAARQKRIMRLEGAPHDFIRVTSGSGSTVPRNIIVVPLVHNNSVEGVIEIASVHAFDEMTMQLLEQASVSIAVALHSAKNRIRLQDLYEETQAQAEELQTQHNELENINAELEAQAQKLQASEEELKVQQEELQNANSELEIRTRLLEKKNQQIVETNLEIQRKADELALTTKYKSEFLANMSHELRTPLNSILLLSRLLSENIEKNLNIEQIEYARVIQNSGQGLLALIDEILDLSKIESGKMTLDIERMPVETTVSNLKAIFTPIAREKNLDFTVNIEEDVPRWIETDSMRMEQILKNLLSNALKFTPRGSVRLDIALDRQSAEKIRFTVTDTGIGIPKEKQQVIFEAFQQADGSTRRKFGGTGLGLSISRELARLLGGEIQLESEANKGSAFSLVVPKDIRGKVAAAGGHGESEEGTVGTETRTENEAENTASKSRYVVRTIPKGIPDDRDTLKPGDKVIMIVEDDTSFAKSLQKLTREKGYKTISIVRGDHVIPMAEKYSPTGILLDIKLPVKDGWDVMDELKRNPATRHIPVHVMSSGEFKKESKMRGAVDFINKPVAMEQLQHIFEKIEHVINKTSNKVLIMEDNPKHARALSYFLDTFDINTEITHSLEAGVKAIRKKDVDCVILDMGIPAQSAYATLEQIRQTTEFDDVPVIVFTGKNLSKSETARIKQYADSIVLKTANSYRNVLDEISLFLHMVEESANEKKTSRRKLGVLDGVLAGKKVLVADDDVRNVFSLTKALQAHKMEVLSAADGKEALRLLEENPDVSIVLMDMMMPEMDGYETTSIIRSNPKFTGLPVIAVTAKAMTGDRERCIKAGASDYISKPVDVDQLLSLLRVWLYHQ
jgi:signal transduction histidine kinase/DNA-binding response OmpR family regulator